MKNILCIVLIIAAVLIGGGGIFVVCLLGSVGLCSFGLKLWDGGKPEVDEWRL